MPTQPLDSPSGQTHTAASAVRIGPDLRFSAAERIVGPGAGPRPAAARRFLEAADALGMDVSNMWGSLDAKGTRVKQVCLAVVGTGRTAMLFVSGPSDPSEPDRIPEDELAAAERRAAIDAACGHLRRLRVEGSSEQQVVLAQALLESEEVAAIEALSAAGFMRLGDLAYLRRSIPRSGSHRAKWPPGIVVRRCSELPDAEERLLTALERSYEETLDCPELCGMRDVADVLESHRSVGEYDPGMWWLVEADGEAEGCMLLSASPEQNAVELVYLGISPRLRGKGIGSLLMATGMQCLTGRSEKSITCAVDTRNEPAMLLYRRSGFQRFATRVPMVLSLRRSANETGGA